MFTRPEYRAPTSRPVPDLTPDHDRSPFPDVPDLRHTPTPQAAPCGHGVPGGGAVTADDVLACPLCRKAYVRSDRA